jgi:hypothetical protein
MGGENVLLVLLKTAEPLLLKTVMASRFWSPPALNYYFPARDGSKTTAA